MMTGYPPTRLSGLHHRHPKSTMWGAHYIYGSLPGRRSKGKGRAQISPSPSPFNACHAGYIHGQQKTCNKCLATLLQNELNSDVAPFLYHPHQTCFGTKIRLLTGLNEGGKTRSIAVQLIL